MNEAMDILQLTTTPQRSTQIHSNELPVLPVYFLFVALANPLLNVFMHRLALGLHYVQELKDESW